MDTITLAPDRPTDLSFAELYRWVLWQFPRHKGDGLGGAVHPPAAETGWYPAVIQPDSQRVLVYAHLEQCFDSPEAAAEWLFNQG
jgi:hypothetical protein